MTHPLILGRRGAALAALGLFAGCANLPPVPTATLPDRTGGGAILDPARQAIFHTASAFASSTPLAGRPAEAAQAISEAEFLAVELRHNSRWTEMSPIVATAFEQARPEWRGALGIAADAPAQAVIDAMTRVRLAYGGQDLSAAAAALAPPLVTPGGQATLARLGALPPLPRTARAASLAEREIWRIQRQGSGDRRWP
ncbi:hypothetical protein [Roseomonas sp. HF4]|uniref:hypothetical protein n=1 Tax=Roseomonas sp. HF4 TaxID=2562313 RepID=UPI0010C015B1|nr:hypothetical protein [Roseomonas sp. HF4]